MDLVAADVLDKNGQPIADKVELHTTRMENGLMKMEHLAGIRIEAGKQARLAPGGNHIMIMGLHQPLTIGEDLVLELVILEWRTGQGESAGHEGADGCQTPAGDGSSSDPDGVGAPGQGDAAG